MENKLKHHTVSDWDFSASIVKILDTTDKVSPPSSLRCTQTVGGELKASILCRIAATQCIAQGEARTWHKTTIETYPGYLIFRNQAALGTSNLTNCYYWALVYNHAWLYRVIAGALVLIGDFSHSNWSGYAWNHLRIIYWNGVNALGVAALASEYYREIAGAWVKIGDTLFDTTNQFKDSATNRSGVGGTLINEQYRYFDDTEIWGPA